MLRGRRRRLPDEGHRAAWNRPEEAGRDYYVVQPKRSKRPYLPRKCDANFNLHYDTYSAKLPGPS